jgi:hypothetical protein
MRVRSLLAAVAIGFIAVPLAFAADAPKQTPPPGKLALVRGTLKSFDGKTIAITTATGEVSAAVSPQFRLSAVEPRKFDQLKATDFVGITSVPGENGHLRAEEIHIIPTAGVGEGEYPWDHHPEGVTGQKPGSMTNGTVSLVHAAKPGTMTNAMISTAPKANGWQLQVTYKGAAMVNGKCVGLASTAPEGKTCTGTEIVDVTPATYIVALVPAKPDEVKAGLTVFGAVFTDDKGQSVLTSMTIERNGIKPQF